MAYVLECLVQILEQDHYHLNLDHIKPQIETLLEKASFLKKLFVQNSSPDVDDSEIANLESRIIDAVHKAEDLIEFYIRDHQVAPELEEDGTSDLELTDVLEEFDSVKGELLKAVALPLAHCFISSPTEYDPSPLKHYPSSNNTVLVGFEDEFKKLLGEVFDEASRLNIISICAPGGMGKTTLAQKLYHHSYIASGFSTRAWVTISKEYNVQAILLALVDGLGKLTITNQMRMETYDKLGEHVRRTLKGRKYFLVFDDIWDMEAWNRIRKFFPGEKNGSVILFTTRYIEVAYGLEPNRGPHQMSFLRESEGWYLFCMEMFGEMDCPAGEFELIGNRIVELCHGHPLIVKLIAGLLSTSKMMPEYWRHVEDQLVFCRRYHDKYDNWDGILLWVAALCYHHLPYHLKPCLLYMGAFPEDYETRASKIIKLWIAEGFIKPISGNSLEDTAEVYLKALVRRNLLSVWQQELNGRIKTFKMHDTLREYCQWKSMNEKFLWYKDLNKANIPENENTMRRVSVPPLSKPSDEMEIMPLARSFLSIGHARLRLASLFLGLRLLRVLDVFQLELYQFPAEILELMLLRYLSFSCHSDLPTSISKLRNLQTLIIHRLPSFRAFSLPSGLWELTQLRHVESKETCILYYPADGNYVIQDKLQTLSNVQLLGVTNEFLGKIPNIRKLGIFCNIKMHTVIDLACLQKLETLKCTSDWSLATRDFLSFLTFPPSLKKLTLRFCKIPCGFMAIIGSLPNLEQLKLQKSDFLGIQSEPNKPEWEPAQGEFASLISLHMEDLKLVHWKANSTDFPKLRHLIILRCYYLQKHPEILERFQETEISHEEQKYWRDFNN